MKRPERPPPTGRSATRGLRVLLYSHDSVGLGHLRRTLSIAGAIQEHFDDVRQLVVTGSSCATQFRLPTGLDLVKLPSIGKDERGAYAPRHLIEDLPAVVRIRRALLVELQRSFRPDVLIVDHKVLGIADELRDLLAEARASGTRTVLGLRDVIDAPEVVNREWERPEIRRAMARDYDRVCVYGAPEVFDPRVEYDLPAEVARDLTFTGYLVRPAGTLSYLPVPRLRPRVLVTVGGGEDGAERLELLLATVEHERPAWDPLLILGPLLDASRARRIKRRARALGIEAHSFYEDLPRLMSGSSAIVAMAGYNTVAEALRHRLPAVLLPRQVPRREQLLRAERLAHLGLAQCLPEARPETLRAAVDRAIAGGRLRGALPPLDGLEQLCAVVEELVGSPRARAEAVSR